jgi:hypothetical protein
MERHGSADRAEPMERSLTTEEETAGSLSTIFFFRSRLVLAVWRFVDEFGICILSFLSTVLFVLCFS